MAIPSTAGLDDGADSVAGDDDVPDDAVGLLSALPVAPSPQAVATSAAAAMAAARVRRRQ
jgi:hypothetical protein